MYKKYGGLIFLIFSILSICFLNINALDINECDNQVYYLNNSKPILESWFVTNPASLQGINISLINSEYYTLVNILTSCEVAPQSFDIIVYQKLADGSTHTYYSGYLGNTTIYYYNYSKNDTSKNDTNIKGDEYMIISDTLSNCSDIGCDSNITISEVKENNKFLDFIKYNWKYSVLAGLVFAILFGIFILLKIKFNKGGKIK